MKINKTSYNLENKKLHGKLLSLRTPNISTNWSKVIEKEDVRHTIHPTKKLVFYNLMTIYHVMHVHTFHPFFYIFNEQNMSRGGWPKSA